MGEDYVLKHAYVLCYDDEVVDAGSARLLKQAGGGVDHEFMSHLTDQLFSWVSDHDCECDEVGRHVRMALWFAPYDRVLKGEPELSHHEEALRIERSFRDARRSGSSELWSMDMRWWRKYEIVGMMEDTGISGHGDDRDEE